MATTPQAQVSPALFFKTINSYQETEALRAAIELNLFTAIDEGALDAKSIGARCGASERGVRILCDYLTILGFLTKQGSEWRLTPDSAAFLSGKSPANLTDAIKFLLSPMLTEPFMQLTQAVRQGGTVVPLHGTMAPDHPIWIEFARSMKSLMAMPAQFLAKLVKAEAGEPWKVLDVAAGHGMFGIEMARRNPNAEVWALDWNAVLDVAREHAQAAGVTARWHALVGSAFDVALGGPYDIVLLTNFLHHFDPPANETLLKRMRGAMQPGGRAVTLEFVPNDDRISPPGMARFSLVMLGSTDAGDAYTFAEYDRMFRAAGFERSEMVEMPGGFARAIVSYA